MSRRLKLPAAALALAIVALAPGLALAKESDGKLAVAPVTHGKPDAPAKNSHNAQRNGEAAADGTAASNSENDVSSGSGADTLATPVPSPPTEGTYAAGSYSAASFPRDDDRVRDSAEGNPMIRILLLAAAGLGALAIAWLFIKIAGVQSRQREYERDVGRQLREIQVTIRNLQGEQTRPDTPPRRPAPAPAGGYSQHALPPPPPAKIFPPLQAAAMVPAPPPVQPQPPAPPSTPAPQRADFNARAAELVRRLNAMAADPAWRKDDYDGILRDFGELGAIAQQAGPDAWLIDDTPEQSRQMTGILFHGTDFVAIVPSVRYIREFAMMFKESAAAGDDVKQVFDCVVNGEGTLTIDAVATGRLTPGDVVRITDMGRLSGFTR